MTTEQKRRIAFEQALARIAAQPKTPKARREQASLEARKAAALAAIKEAK